jgi:sugar/nucleoside kinase (ribokinase family)
MGIKAQYSFVIGTGGIGTGKIYRLEGNHDLGRNESRMGHLLPVKDFCKLHIIFHYIAVLVKELKLSTAVYPIGAVGDDIAGKELFSMMEQSGMNMKYVTIMENTPTLHSICFQFPDDSGGNITENESASSKVSSEMISAAESLLRPKHSIVLSAPEVPLSSRIEIINLGYRNQAFVVASFNSDEIETVLNSGLLKKLDLLSVNLDEAATLGNVDVKASVEDIVQSCIKSAVQINPQIKLCITCGEKGIYGYHGGKVEYLPVLNVPVKNTAGAGDAVISGMIAGVILGYPFISDKERSCLRLGRLMGAMSVTSPHTINFDMTLLNLKHFQKTHNECILQ